MTAPLVACAPVQKPEGGYTFVDDLGRTVTVESAERVACLLGSFADMWMLAGGKLAAAASDAFTDFKIPKTDDITDLGAIQRPSREELIASDPDLVFASAKLSKQLELRDTLEMMGISVAFFDVGDFEDYLRVLKIMTDITNKPENYEKYGESQKSGISAVIERHKDDEAKTVLVMRASASSIRAKKSADTMLGEMLSDFGCINIADSDDSLLDDLNIESIVLADPHRIFFIETGDGKDTIKTAVETMFSENPLWYELDAVKNGRVHFMEKALFNLKPNARFEEAYLVLEKILYEE